jgi:hypothetical protein
MTYQDLNRITRIVSQHISRNPNVRLSTLFTQARNHPGFSSYGDYALISEIILSCARKRKFFEPKHVARVFRSTNDPGLNYQRANSPMVAFLTNRATLTDILRGY